LADSRGDAGKDFEGEVAALGGGGRPGGRIDLDQGDLSAGAFEFEESPGVLLDFLERGFLVIEGREEALDNERTLPAKHEDIGQDLFEGDVGAVDLVEVGLGAAIELGPDLVAVGEILKALLDVGEVKAGAVGDEDELKERKPAQGTDMDDGLEGLGKPGGKRGLAVAAQGDMAELEELVRQGMIPGTLPQTAGADQGEGLFQLGGHDVDIEGVAGCAIALNLAVDAIIVADLFRAEVHADGESSRAGGNHRIDKAVVEKITRTAKSGLGVAIGAPRELPSPFGRVGQVGSKFFHSSGSP